METLKGKSILIGREPSKGRLLVFLEGVGKMGAIGSEGSVPESVSRCKANEKVGHARLSIDANGNLSIENLKAANVTYVNGKEIVKKKVQLTDAIEMGKDHYNVSLPVVIDLARKLTGVTPPPPPPPPAQKFNIRHLERVWDEYEEEQEAIVKKQQEANRKRMLPIMVGSISGIASPLLMTVAGSALFVTVPVAIVSFGLYFTNYRKKDTSYQDRKAAQEKFVDNYVCPNPECNKFLGNLSYKLVKKQYGMHCPYCKCEYTEI